MNKFKVGDVIRNIDNLHYDVGAIGKVIGVNDDGYVKVNLKSKTIYGERNYWAYQDWMELISRAPETPPTTIEHAGYTYNRGERVRPDWLKDGEWVVNKETGDKFSIELREDGKICFIDAKEGVHLKTSDYSILDQYRPHEPSDYKWGDWAMYEGKRVFVMCGPDSDSHIAISGTGMNNSLSNWKFVRPHDLTPTHAP